MVEKMCDPQAHDVESVLTRKLGGPEGLKTIGKACRAIDEGRYGYAELMVFKDMLHDIPVYQFSSGETPKPAATPSVKSPQAPGQSK